MTAYYNEIDPFAALWLRNLIKAGLIADGDVDERSITEVKPEELKKYTQCHFFAGIGTWSYALRMAGWSDDEKVWTGSCPCQPFSAAGKRKGTKDERHLWPTWFSLIKECKPDIIFGEQVSSKDALAWFDIVQNNLENENYAVGAIDSCAAGIGAPHIRQRLYWVANTDSGRCKEGKSSSETSGHGRSSESMCSDDRHEPARQDNFYWADTDWLFCRDGKWRSVESGTFPLANGITKRAGRLRAYGNAIVAPQAKTFIESYMEIIDGNN